MAIKTMKSRKDTTRTAIDHKRLVSSGTVTDVRHDAAIACRRSVRDTSAPQERKADSFDNDKLRALITAFHQAMHKISATSGLGALPNLAKCFDDYSAVPYSRYIAHMSAITSVLDAAAREYNAPNLDPEKCRPILMKLVGESGLVNLLVAIIQAFVKQHVGVPKCWAMQAHSFPQFGMAQSRYTISYLRSELQIPDDGAPILIIAAHDARKVKGREGKPLLPPAAPDGETHVLALMLPALVAAFPEHSMELRLTSRTVDDDLLVCLKDSHLILLGAHDSNGVTDAAIRRYGKDKGPAIWFQEHEKEKFIQHPVSGARIRFSFKYDAGCTAPVRSSDCGIQYLRGLSPWNKKRKLSLFAGCWTYGTAGAARDICTFPQAATLAQRANRLAGAPDTRVITCEGGVRCPWPMTSKEFWAI